jgi:hypothetical protein
MALRVHGVVFFIVIGVTCDATFWFIAVRPREPDTMQCPANGCRSHVDGVAPPALVRITIS